MSKLNIISAASKIHHLTNLNTYIIEQNKDFIFHHKLLSIPTFMPGSEDSDIFDFHLEIQQQSNQLYAYINKWGLHYLGYSFSQDKDYTVIIGPYMELTPNLLSLSRQYELSNIESEYLKLFCDQLQILSTEVVLSYSSILQLFDMMINKNVAPKQIEKTTIYEQNDEYHIASDVSKIVNLRYKAESDLLYAVRQGDKDSAKKLISPDNTLFSFTERFPSQPLRRVKNFAIILNTLLRTVARESQVPPILIHRLSETFAIQIENINQLVELNKLYDDIIEGYCDLIISNSLSDCSKTTQKVIEHILVSYDKSIDIKELAASFFTHPSHLSRKFKQDTNMTITAYQQNIRIERAKYLLQNNNVQIEEIAWMVGYEDSSYFTRVFKQKTGYTPSQFRNL